MIGTIMLMKLSSSLEAVVPHGAILSPRNHLEGSGDILGCYILGKGKLLASCEERPGTLLSFP